MMMEFSVQQTPNGDILPISKLCFIPNALWTWERGGKIYIWHVRVNNRGLKDSFPDSHPSSLSPLQEQTAKIYSQATGNFYVSCHESNITIRTVAIL
jgi:hypothetical protein